MTDAKTAAILSGLCKALGHEHRVQILQVLSEHREGKTVGDLQAALDIPWSTLSHHIEWLARVGLVEKHRMGREQVCTLGVDAAMTIVETMSELVQEPQQS